LELIIQVTQLTHGPDRSKLIGPYDVETELTCRYAYYNSKEGHHAMAAEGHH